MINRPITSLLGSAVPMAQQQLGYTRQPPMMNVPAPQIQSPAGLSSLLAPAPQQKPSMISGLLSGPGSSARYAALAKALTQNSATPMSFGQRLTGGLLAGSDAAAAQQEAAFNRGLLEDKMALDAEKVRLQELELTGKASKPKWTKMNVGGNDVLIDTNPSSSTYQQTIKPGDEGADLPAFESMKTTPTEEEIKSVPFIEDSAQGDLFGAGARGIRGVAGLAGIEASKETTRAEYFVENLNKDLRLNLVQDLGGRLTKVVSDELNKILPNPLSDNNTEFKVKAEELVDFSEKRIAEINSKLPSMTEKERKEAINLIDGLSSKVRSYKAMLEKQRQFDTGTGVYAKKSDMSTDQLMQEYNSISDRLGVLNR